MTIVAIQPIFASGAKSCHDTILLLLRRFAIAELSRRGQFHSHDFLLYRDDAGAIYIGVTAILRARFAIGPGWPLFFIGQGISARKER